MAIADRIAVMHEGRIVQMAPPLEVYRRPATTFVASFLGSPPMNLLPFRVHDGARPHLTSDAVEVPLAAADARALAERVGDGGDLTVGIRPEHLRLVPHGGPGTVSGEPYAIETLGPESLVTLKVGDVLLTVRVFSDDPPDVDGLAHLAFDVDHLHYFRSSGERIERA